MNIKKVFLLKREKGNDKEVYLLNKELGVEKIRLTRFNSEGVKLSPKM